MPQMAPLSWLLLFIMFIIIFMLFNVMNYFSFLYPVSHKTKKKSTQKINWKW
uniref:ATP synthase F0 subunit 8 n=1 Tax=Eupatorus gracilicornis TaxID=1247164 RepID=UPI0021155490|nr:ATP synthase F0 subunit 8 [Eupatorus gracilicornis]USN89943.1 ATP synthase F0 subunit 8 [Eupatorus gracilicornis]